MIKLTISYFIIMFVNFSEKASPLNNISARSLLNTVVNFHNDPARMHDIEYTINLHTVLSSLLVSLPSLFCSLLILVILLILYSLPRLIGQMYVLFCEEAKLSIKSLKAYCTQMQTVNVTHAILILQGASTPSAKQVRSCMSCLQIPAWMIVC